MCKVSIKWGVFVLKVYIFLSPEIITNIANRTYVKQMKRSKFTVSKVHPKKGQQVLDTIIKNATQLWIRTPVHLRSPLQFLQLSSHCINDTIYYASLEDLKTMRKQQQDDNTFGIAKSTVQKYPSSSSSLYAMSTVRQVPSSYLQQSMSMPQTFRQQQIIQGRSTQIVINSNKTMTLNNQDVQQQPVMPVKSNDPPPLAFFPKVIVQRKILSLSEPPPLVPIGSSRNDWKSMNTRSSGIYVLIWFYNLFSFLYKIFILFISFILFYVVAKADGCVKKVKVKF